MAQTTRNGRSNTAQYEDFQPKYEWKQEEEANILLVHLPDFEKEKLKITYVHSFNTIRVNGERSLPNGKLSRFHQVFPVPENCEVNKINARFQNGVLTITMPKSITEDGVKETAKATEPEKPAQPSTGKEGSEKIADPQIPQKAAVEAKAQKGTEDAASFASQKQPDGKQVEKAKEKTGLEREEIKQEEKAKEKTVLEQEERVKEKTALEREESGKKPEEMAKETTAFEREEISKKRKESMIANGEETSKKRKESMIVDETAEGKSAKITDGEEKLKDDFISEKIKEAKNAPAAAIKALMKGYGAGPSEERQAMINMGVAVLVIAAIGAYIYYGYGSPGKTKD